MTASTARAAAVARGWPPKVVAWSPGWNASATSARAQQAPMGTPLPSALAMVTTSGRTGAFESEALEAEPVAGAPEAGLDLVDHEQQTPLVAQGADAGEVLGGGRVHAALALDRLQQDGRDRRVDGRLQGVEVVPGHVAEPLGQRLKGLVLGRLAGGVEGGEGPAVERPVGADDLVAAVAAPFAGQLDGALVGLGPAVAEKDPAPAAEQPVEGGRHLATGQGAVQVGDVQQGPGLLVQGVGHRRVGVAERRDGQAGEEVEVSLSLVVPQVAALAADEGHRAGGG